MPFMMLLTYVLMRIYPFIWALAMFVKHTFNLPVYQDNTFAAVFIFLTFWSLMFNNHFRYLRLHDKILMLIAPIYFTIMAIDEMTINYFSNITINPLLGAGVVLIMILTFYLDSLVD